jgi:hypothetical protein
MERARIQAILIGLGMTVMIALPLFLSAQPPLEVPGDHVAAPAAEPPAVGRPAPPIHLVTFKGQPWKLADLRDKKAALMVFWASW